MTPVFLISLPRSGSTLLQRLMMGHPAIASTSEPWLMLPLVYMLREDGLVSEYAHRSAYRGIHDFIKVLPQGQQDYQEAVRHFVSDLYERQCQRDELYFLDKTPRYYLIIKELAETFPEAKFILLVRNPLQVIASIIKTFSDNNLRVLHFFWIDMLQGFTKMSEGIRSLGNRATVVRYEDIVEREHETLDELFSFLSLNWDPQMNERLDDRGLQGRMGDRVGTYQYQKVATASQQKWKDTLSERTRKNYVQHLLNRLDAEVLATYGYEKEHLLRELDELKTKVTLQSVSDLYHIALSKVIGKLYLNLFRSNIKRWSDEIILN